ncbi:MAG: phosphoglycerate dehydrogenase [Verrucomicrobiales bacterium]|jgi:D-3-phosphoglycerate dehydrogenase|nr:phosphoglycerate dehydrogenase [Verrucomicrobiales bacterium]
MDTRRVLVADPIAERGIELLKEAEGIEVDVKLGLSEEELISLAPNYEGIIVRSGVKITAPIIEAGSGVLRAIGRAGVGVDNIDIPTATKHGVVVMNTPAGNTISTAEHAFTLMMSLARHIPQAHQSVTDGRFKEGRKAYKGVELYNKTLAILGMGRIGGEFARRAMGFGMRVVAYDPYMAASKAKNMRVELCATVDEAVEQADFITLHMPKTPETTHLINAVRIELMKPGVRIINCARGGLIDEAALLEGLKSGKIAGAALDVFEDEPPSADYELLSREEMVFTPHLGASTEEAQENVGIEIAEAIRDRLLHGAVVNAVNMPNLDENTLKEIGPYLKLAETLGKFAGQAGPTQPDAFRVEYVGAVGDLDTTLVTRSALKGYLETGGTSGSANYLNAPSLAEDRGIRLTESRPAEESDYTDLLTVIVGNDKESIHISGTFFGSQPRIVRIDEHNIDAYPDGNLLIFENNDTPGVVGALGQLLGKAGINIANMSLSRNQVGGQALSILNVDSAISDEVIAEILKVEGIQSAKSVEL